MLVTQHAHFLCPLLILQLLIFITNEKTWAKRGEGHWHYCHSHYRGGELRPSERREQETWNFETRKTPGHATHLKEKRCIYKITELKTFSFLLRQIQVTQYVQQDSANLTWVLPSQKERKNLDFLERIVNDNIKRTLTNYLIFISLAYFLYYIFFRVLDYG